MIEEKYRAIMIVGVYLAIILLILAIVIFIKNIEEIRKDPIIYGMEKHDFVSCVCYEEDGRYTVIELKDYKINSDEDG